MVSPSRAATSRPSSMKVMVLPPWLLSFVVMASPLLERFAQLFREIFQHAQERVRRRLAEAADRCVTHGVGQLGQQARVPGAMLHQLDGFLGADAAGRALPAAFVFEE